MGRNQQSGHHPLDVSLQAELFAIQSTFNRDRAQADSLEQALTGAVDKHKGLRREQGLGSLPDWLDNNITVLRDYLKGSATVQIAEHSPRTLRHVTGDVGLHRANQQAQRSQQLQQAIQQFQQVIPQAQTPSEHHPIGQTERLVNLLRTVIITSAGGASVTAAAAGESAPGWAAAGATAGAVVGALNGYAGIPLLDPPNFGWRNVFGALAPLPATAAAASVANNLGLSNVTAAKATGVAAAAMGGAAVFGVAAVGGVLAAGSAAQYFRRERPAGDEEAALELPQVRSGQGQNSQSAVQHGESSAPSISEDITDRSATRSGNLPAAQQPTNAGITTPQTGFGERTLPSASSSREPAQAHHALHRTQPSTTHPGNSGFAQGSSQSNPAVTRLYELRQDSGTPGPDQGYKRRA
jgi:hypothetical protein